MISTEIAIQNKLGLHARAASKFVATSKEFSCDIAVTSPHASANGKSIMNVMLLQASKGTHISITCTGDDEKAALDALTDLINNKFDEDE